MTPADHAELSAQLARALGWRIVDVVEVTDYEGQFAEFADTVCRVRHKETRFSRLFDYLDPSVALPVLEWLMREHGATLRMVDGKHAVVCRWASVWGVAATLREAIARAAIAVGGGKCQQVEQNEAREVLQP